MSIENLTKKEKICLTIIVFALAFLILSIGYFCYIPYDTIENYNRISFALVAFFSALIFIFASRYLTTGSLKYENFYSEVEIVVTRKYEVFQLTFNIFYLLATIILVLIVLNDNLFNNIFNYKSLSYLENIIISNGDLEHNIKMADIYMNSDKKLNAVKAICILLYAFPLSYNLSSLLVWYKYKKQS